MYTPTVQREQAMEIAELAAALDRKGLSKALKKIADTPLKRSYNSLSHTWQANALNMVSWLQGKRQAPYTIMTVNNTKMNGVLDPFHIFSALPLVTCPGKGDCAEFCYSLKAWRYPQPFFRQVQNTILVKEQSPVLVEAFNRIPENATLRLYVDGDIDSLATLRFWFGLLNTRPDIRAYGYSKSWEVFLKHKGSFPSNYVLNLSSGSRYSVSIRKQVEALPVTRGSFVALETGSRKAHIKSEASWAGYAKSLREKAVSEGLGKVFVCPGRCGACTGAGHACGMGNMKLPIVIGMH